MLAERGPGSRSRRKLGKYCNTEGNTAEGLDIPGLLVGTDGSSGKRMEASLSSSTIEGKGRLNSDKVKWERYSEDAVDEDGDGGPNDKGDIKE